MYKVLVRCSYTTYMWPSLTCTAYSCQAMKAPQMEETDRPRLSKAAVVERGLALADAEGLEAVTIRRLASDLGVTPMALYWHFKTKDELLSGLADSIWAESDVDLDQSAGWADQLRGLL